MMNAIAAEAAFITVINSEASIPQVQEQIKGILASLHEFLIETYASTLSAEDEADVWERTTAVNKEAGYDTLESTYAEYARDMPWKKNAYPLPSR